VDIDALRNGAGYYHVVPDRSSGDVVKLPAAAGVEVFKQ